MIQRIHQTQNAQNTQKLMSTTLKTHKIIELAETQNVQITQNLEESKYPDQTLNTSGTNTRNIRPKSRNT